MPFNVDERLLRLAKTPPNCLLLIEPQIGAVDVILPEIIRKALCLKEGAVNCSCQACHLLKINTHPDAIFVPERVKIEEIREILLKMQQTPFLGARRIVYLPNVNNLNESVLNALLKTLEEPQASTHFILSAQNRRAVKPTILSRSQVFTLPMISEDMALDYLCGKFKIARQVALELLQNSRGNPFAAKLEAIVHPDSHIEKCVKFLCIQDNEYLRFLDEFKGNHLNYVMLQIEALIHAKQLKFIAENWNNLKKLNLKELNINKLHHLYSSLQKLYRPSYQQLNILINIKGLLIEYHSKRNFL